MCSGSIRGNVSVSCSVEAWTSQSCNREVSSDRPAGSWPWSIHWDHQTSHPMFSCPAILYNRVLSQPSRARWWSRYRGLSRPNCRADSLWFLDGVRGHPLIRRYGQRHRTDPVHSGVRQRWCRTQYFLRYCSRRLRRRFSDTVLHFELRRWCPFHSSIGYLNDRGYDGQSFWIPCQWGPGVPWDQAIGCSLYGADHFQKL